MNCHVDLFRRDCRGLLATYVGLSCPFFGPLGSTVPPQGLKTVHVKVFNIFKIAARASNATLGRPRALLGAPFFCDKGRGGAQGCSKFLNTPPQAPLGAPRTVKQPKIELHDPLIQVKAFKLKYCFSSQPQTLFFVNVAVAPTGTHIF